MAETDDAHKLSSGHLIEEVYADYANRLKALGNKARKEMRATGKIAYSASAKRVYQKEVASLDAKLELAEANAPKERRAQIIANVKIASMKQDYCDIVCGFYC